MVAPVALNDLAAALDIRGRTHLALVGGGGKTTILHALGRQLTGPRILTSTTKMGSDEGQTVPVLIGADDDAVARAAASGAVIVWSRLDGTKAMGVDPGRCDDWFRDIGHVIVEADGSRRRPFKAPRELEPIVPASATLVVSVIGADALGRVIADRCHRPLRVAALAGCRASERLTPRRAAAALMHDRGARRAVPPGAELIVAVTKIDNNNAPAVDELATELHRLSPTLRVIPVSMSSPNPTPPRNDGVRS